MIKVTAFSVYARNYFEKTLSDIKLAENQEHHQQLS